MARDCPCRSTVYDHFGTRWLRKWNFNLHSYFHPPISCLLYPGPPCRCTVIVSDITETKLQVPTFTQSCIFLSHERHPRRIPSPSLVRQAEYFFVSIRDCKKTSHQHPCTKSISLAERSTHHSTTNSWRPERPCCHCWPTNQRYPSRPRVFGVAGNPCWSERLHRSIQRIGLHLELER